MGDLLDGSSSKLGGAERICRLVPHEQFSSQQPCACQIGKEHLGLKAITEVLQDLQYKVRKHVVLLIALTSAVATSSMRFMFQ